MDYTKLSLLLLETTEWVTRIVKNIVSLFTFNTIVSFLLINEYSSFLIPRGFIRNDPFIIKICIPVCAGLAILIFNKSKQNTLQKHLQ